MAVDFSPIRTSFRADTKDSGVSKPDTIAESKPDSAQNNSVKEDTYLSATPKKKKGVLTRIKDGFINFRKSMIDIGYITAGAVKGAVYGAAAGTLTIGAVAIKNMIKHAPKTVGTGGKILAGAIGIGTMALTILNSKLKANQSKSNLDHRWKTGHNE